MTHPEPSGPAAAPMPGPSEPVLPPDTTRQRVTGFGLAAVLLVAGVGYVVWDDAASDAESVVADYFDAIIAKDVDLALSYVAEDRVPVGEEAVFLDPKAIADGWELLDTDGSMSGSEDRGVTVTLGNGGERESGVVEVTRSDGGWRVSKPFVTSSIAPGPLSYLQVNDKVVELDRLHAHDVSRLGSVEYKLFPGLNRFYEDVKAASSKSDPAKLLFPTRSGPSEVQTAGSPDLKFTPEALDELQQSVNEVIDECAGFKVRQPLACPFGVEPAFTSEKGERYEAIRDITWSVSEYPKVTVAKPEGAGLGAPVGWEDPGEIALNATASTDTDDSVKLKAKCWFSTEGMRVGFDRDGKPRVYPPVFDWPITAAAYPTETCESKPSEG